MRQLFIFFFALTISAISYGQTINIQAGTSLANLEWKVDGNEDLVNCETMVGYSVLVGMNYLDKKYFNFSTNLGLIRKGGQIDADNTNDMGDNEGTATIKAKLDYFTVNTTLDIKYPLNDNFTPFISVGPHFDFLMSHSYTFDEIDDMDALETYNYGLLLGCGLKYDLPKIQIGIRADYYFNSEIVASWPQESNNLGGTIKDKSMTTINVMVGYKL